MKSQLRRLLYSAGVAFFCLASNAGATSTFKLTSAGGNTVLGGVYTTPYVATIDGVAGIKVFCDDYVDEVTLGVQWDVNATSLAALPLLATQPGQTSPLLWDTGSTDGCSTNALAKSKCAGNPDDQAFDYLTAALLVEQSLALNPLSIEAQRISYAIWDVFAKTGTSFSASNTSTNHPLSVADKNAIAQYLNDAKLAAAQSIANLGTAGALGLHSNVIIYTASPKIGNANIAHPQEFIAVRMAEAPFPAILGFDLLCVAGLLLFMRRRAVRVAL